MLQNSGTAQKSSQYNYPFKVQWLLYIPPVLTFKNSKCCSYCINVLCVDVKTATFASYKINKVVLHNTGGMCIMSGTQ
jgi:hypothetical protein